MRALISSSFVSPVLFSSRESFLALLFVLLPASFAAMLHLLLFSLLLLRIRVAAVLHLLFPLLAVASSSCVAVSAVDVAAARFFVSSFFKYQISFFYWRESFREFLSFDCRSSMCVCVHRILLRRSSFCSCLLREPLFLPHGVGSVQPLNSHENHA